ncbi:MAG: tRNA lysidine(34) synthetase TilS [Lachnospiraceae bacterium]|nr:tRNA lysidine(34) synthetase TilS [Lachnospiraceae bacterium]
MDEMMAGGPVRLVIGVSGGADSICLLFLMKKYLPGENIRVLHINHMIRGMDADEDSLFVKNICENEGLFFKEIKEDVPELAKTAGCSEEEAGRKLRYESFEKEAAAWEQEEGLPAGSVKIAVAHHIEDSAETFLFNLFRGSGIRGLSGIADKRDRIIRPLLNATREDIEEYLESIGRDFRTDSTNSDTSYARNRIRNLILPEASRICSTASGHIASASRKLRDITEYLDDVVDDACKTVIISSDGKVTLMDKKAFNDLPGVIASMLILKVLTSMTPGKKDIGEVHAGAVMNMAKADSGKHLDLPYGISADFSHDRITLARGIDSDDEDSVPEAIETLMKASDLSQEEKDALFDPSNPLNRYTKYFDCDKISLISSKFGITGSQTHEIRARRSGDYLVIRDRAGNPCKKSVSDYLTDLKLSAPDKDKIRVLAVGNEVLWVIGYRMGDSAKLTEDTVNILKVEVEAKNGRTSY